MIMQPQFLSNITLQYLLFYNSLNFSLDIWLNDASQPPIVRKAVLGYTYEIGGICNN